MEPEDVVRMSAQPSDLKLSQPRTSVSTPSTTCRAGIFRHENKKSDNGWAKAGNVQLGFRGAIGSAMVVTARLLLRVPAASVFLDLSSAAVCLGLRSMMREASSHRCLSVTPTSAGSAARHPASFIAEWAEW
jgi:hypothetical protein